MKSDKHYKLSLLLPALTIVIFSSIIFINKNIVTPPKYSVLITRTEYKEGYPSLSMEVKDGKLIANIDFQKENKTVDKLFSFSAKSDEILDIPYLEQINLEDKTNRTQEIIINNINIVSQSEVSPDGFKYKPFKYSSSFGDASLINTNGTGLSSLNKFFYKKSVKEYSNKFLAWVEVKDHE